MIDRTALVGLAIAIAAGGAGSLAAADETPTPQQVEFFELKVRPILAGTCQKCHGATKQKGGLRLDSRDSILKGGESGAAIVPGKPDESPMIDAINYRGLEMPPTGRLGDREVAALTEWVRMGAPWPARKSPLPRGTTEAARGDSGFTITDEDRRYWAFQPVGHPQPPPLKRPDWVANPIDAFVLARLEAKGLQPNGPAEPRALCRRVFFDLIGLPPSPEEIDAFAADPSPAAYERLVDGLLARKEFGERWGRHWLDVARFAQTNGYERDAEKPEAWRYRDYVIRAFNDDKPYNRFIVEQLAGDELPDPTHDSIIATGFYRLGIWDDEPDDKRVAAWDELDEIVRTTGAAFLGLTLGCARCHNHMFDPIPQEDYYRFAAFFRNVEPYGTPKGPNHFKENDEGIFTPLVEPEAYAAWKARQAERERQLADANSSRAEIRKAARDRLVAAQQSGPLPDDKLVDRALSDSERARIKRLDEAIARLERELARARFPRALSVRECGGPLKETRTLVRGNVASPGRKVEPRVPVILGTDRRIAAPASLTSGQSSTSRRILTELGVKPTLGLRRELAGWIADEQNPLTARVMMNRLWQGYFGRGIVRSSDNFGRAGSPPTHPELLAWLARDFMDGSWRLKRVHRTIVLSNAYRMSSSNANAQAHAIDADNDLFWRQNLRRLEAEAIRDAMLSVSGRLNPAMGGRGIFPSLADDVLATQSKPGFGWGKSTPQEESRRSVYIYLKRTLMVPFLETFDYTNTAESLGVRPVTTVAPQALLLLNSRFADEQAGHLAERVRREAGPQPARQVERLFRRALGRVPTAREAAVAQRLLSAHAADSPPATRTTGVDRNDPLRSLCLVVLNLNEFVYLD
jgi:mono/diheme cytochrome c family protein